MKRRSSNSVSSVFVWVCSLPRLNRLPSKRLRMYTAPTSSSMTCLRIMLKKMLNRVSARTQPCFTPLTMGKDPEKLQFNLTLCSWINMLRNFGEQPRRSMIIHSSFLLTVSNASVRSTNATYSPLFFSSLVVV